MRVLFCQGRLSDRGGADRWLLGVLARLQGRVETALAVGQTDAALPAAERARVGPVLRVKGLDRAGLAGRGAAGAVDGLRAAIRDVAPDVIFANDVVDPALLDLLADTGRGAMLVQDHRSFCPGAGKALPDGRICQNGMSAAACAGCFTDDAYAARLLALTGARARAVARLSRVVVLSSYMAVELARVGVPARHLAVVPPFVDALPALPRAPRWHLFAGRLVSHKGVDVALAAAARLRVPAPLVVAGDGPLGALVAAAAGEGRVQLAGWADRAAMGRLLAGAHSLWLPSRWAEPFGIVGLEALAAGVPVVAADAGGVRDWLEDGRSGALVPPGDADALAAAADALAADPARAAAMGQAGVARVARDFAPDRIVDNLIQIFREVAAEAPGIA